MALKVQRWAGSAVAAVVVLTATTGSAGEIATVLPAAPHVRSITPRFAAAVERASQRSRTFRQLVDIIQQSDSYVYLTEGYCGYGIRGCVVSITDRFPYNRRST